MSELRLGVAPLSEHERRWLADLEDVFRRMPRRLLLVESGDALFVVDRNAARSVDLYDGRARTNGVVLATVLHGTMKVTGVSG